MSKQSSHRKHSNKSASITVRFLFPEESSWTEKKIENCRTVRNVGLEDRKKPTKPQGGDYNYSGMHDSGILPPPKEGGDFSLLIEMSNQARTYSDELLTSIIEKNNSAKRGKNGIGDRNGLEMRTKKRNVCSKKQK